MQSRSRLPEESLGGPRPRLVITAGGADAEPAAIALLCLVNAFYPDRFEASA